MFLDASQKNGICFWEDYANVQIFLSKTEGETGNYTMLRKLSNTGQHTNSSAQLVCCHLVTIHTINTGINQCSLYSVKLVFLGNLCQDTFSAEMPFLAQEERIVLNCQKIIGRISEETVFSALKREIFKMNFWNIFVKNHHFQRWNDITRALNFMH